MFSYLVKKKKQNIFTRTCLTNKFVHIMLKSNTFSFFFLFFIFLSVAKIKKTQRNLYYNFLGTLDNNKLYYYQNEFFFFPHIRKNVTTRNSLKLIAGEKPFFKYDSKYKIVQLKNNKKKEKTRYMLKGIKDVDSHIDSCNNDKSNNSSNVKNCNMDITNVSHINNTSAQKNIIINKHDPGTIKSDNSDSNTLLNYDIKNGLEKEIIEKKIQNKKNEIIKTIQMPIIGTQLKPSGGFT
ncbi:conserved protein, unknown function, partial [Hepatocystis sp. ex Piliocolobus tephrosceles]